ncbi:MAG: IclR family transcriptional regulator [Fusobacteriaceae bacterium]|jgi:DNA-binding IclR family transcriptional regulator|nr:IclR family transcriptional regulator [Fusobacteriaceae bacterium]
MIQSLVRAMELLEVLNGSKSSYSIAYLSSALNLPPSTIHRLLQTLCGTKFVVKDEKSHDYKLGPALIPLGITARKNLHLQNAATPILERLVTVTTDDSYLVISTGYKGFVLEHIDGPSPLKVLEDFGFELDLHCGAIRKTLLAYQPEAFIEEYIETVIKTPNAFPKVEPAVLLENLEKIRKEGVAVSHGDYISNSVGIGAPVFNSEGKIIASIGIITPASKIAGEKKLNELKQTVKTSAQELSEMMGFFK